MKKLASVAVLCITYFGSFSQTVITKESNQKFSTGSQNAIATTIYENNLNNILSEWKKVLGDFKNEKIKENGKEVFGDNLLIKDWGNNPVDFYTTFEEDKKAKSVKMNLAVDLGGKYLASSTDGEKFDFIEKLVKDFALKMTKEPITLAVKASEKLLTKLENNQVDLEKENKKLKENTEDYKKKITKSEKDIIDKDAEIEKKKSELQVQKKVVDASSGAVNEQAKSSKKILEKLEGQLKDIEKEKKNLKKDIEDYNKKIKKIELELKTNEENQTKKKTEIDNQKRVVDDVKRKLDAVD